jgi:hypothetical protein
MTSAEPRLSNPFFHRGPIRDPAYFFGRGQESSHIAGLLAAGQSVALSGSRRFGKTSLLFRLAHPQVATTYELGPETTRWVYLDGGMLDGLPFAGGHFGVMLMAHLQQPPRDPRELLPDLSAGAARTLL